MDQDKAYKKILKSLLLLVEEQGWCEDSLKQACEKAKISYAETFSMEAHPVDTILAYYSESLDETMLKSHKNKEFKELKIREKISALVMARLKAIEPHKEAGHKALIYFSMPQNAGLGTKLMYNSVNQMWYAAGDESTDYNFYSKRFLLSGVYSSTLLYWFQDASPDSVSTRSFLARRIDNVMLIQKAKSGIKDLLGKVF